MGQLITKDRITISVSTMPGVKWDTIGDRTIKREGSKMRRAAGAPQEIDFGKAEHDNLALEAFWDTSTHPALWNQIETNPAQFDNATITTQELDASGVPIPGTAKSSTGCGIAEAKRDGGDANNGKDKVKATITWMVPL